jgi:tRNA(Ile)-lysidine synthase
MLAVFSKFVDDQGLITKTEKVLLAVSGGRDSVVMCRLFSLAGIRFGIAHCNFGLRGVESDEDEKFVRALADHYRAPIYVHRFRTASYAEKHGISIQMAARELRYKWFEQVRKKEGYSAIATAHHKDDQAETFFLNLLRNAGIAGFHGIRVRQDHIIRPLMFATREEITAWAKENKLRYRDDSSNADTKYLRNRIRKKIIPAFNSIHPGFDRIISETIERMAETEKIYREAVESRRKEIVTRSGGRVIIPIDAIRKLEPVATWLHEFLAPYGFNFTVVKEVIRSLTGSPGKKFTSPTHILIRDRNNLIIGQLKERKPEKHISIPESRSRITSPIPLSFQKIPKDGAFRINYSQRVANLDADKIEWPLMLRKWEQGDYFHPFGRNIRKKLSDFFIDRKLSLLDKENTWLLCSDDRIVWVVGHRIDNRFRITQRTREVLRIEWMGPKGRK